METAETWRSGQATWRRLRRGRPFRWSLLIIAVATVAVAHYLYFAPLLRSLAIRDVLSDAASAVHAMPTNEPGRAVADALRAYFPDRDIAIDAQRFPTEVDVTFPDLDQRSCLELRQAAGRMEGLVLVKLEGYADPHHCGEHNRMTWRIMP
jgi:hypothetical protein